MNATACIDPGARICLLRHLYALSHGLDGKPCHSCEPAAEVVAVLRGNALPKRKPKALVKALPAKVPEALPAPEAPQAEPARLEALPVLDGIDLEALRKVLGAFLIKQDKTGQRSVYIERLLSLYNPAAPKGSRFGGKRRFITALVAVPGLSMQGEHVLLDKGCRTFCMGDLKRASGEW